MFRRKEQIKFNKEEGVEVGIDLLQLLNYTFILLLCNVTKYQIIIAWQNFFIFRFVLNYSLDGDGFSQISWEVDVNTLVHSQPVGNQL